MFDDETVKKRFSEVIKTTTIDLGFFMFQCSTLFSYYHELGHLIQYRNLHEFEQYENSNNDDFELIKNITELDADLNGVGNMLYHVIEYFEELESKVNSKILIENASY